MIGTPKRTGARTFLVIIAVLFVTTLALLTAYRLMTGKSLGLRSAVTGTVDAGANVIALLRNDASIKASSQGDFRNIIFLHHSTGNNMVNQSPVRQMLTEADYVFYDHGFNRKGLRGPTEKGNKYHYLVPNDNTDPDGLYAIFQQPLLPLPLNTFTALMRHEVIVIKSCFAPANNIASDEQLEQYKTWYRSIRGVMAQHPDRLFVIMTTPPLNPAETNPEQAARARAFANWLKSEEFLAGQSNIATFDFYNLLAEDDPTAPDYNMLRAEFREGTDSHPNRAANEATGPQFAQFLMDTAGQYRAAVASR